MCLQIACCSWLYKDYGLISRYAETEDELELEPSKNFNTISKINRFSHNYGADLLLNEVLLVYFLNLELMDILYWIFVTYRVVF
jgi:hypothetical protein